MVIKILWVLIGINTIALLIFIGAYFVINDGKNVDYQEKGWTFILAAVGLLVILLAAVPLRFNPGVFGLIFTGFFAVLPLAIFISVFVSKKLAASKKQRTFATTYYKDKNQREIAAAIEQSDIEKLKELIKGQDLNIQGNRVWDVNGLNYLQFAIRLRSNPLSFPFNEEANMAAIKLLIANGAATTPALAEAVDYLPPKALSIFFDAGADPNCRGFVNPNPLLFEVIERADQTDIAILLLQKGANVNAINDVGWTPVMAAAHRAATSKTFADTWRLVRYLLEEAHADYLHTSKKGHNLGSIIKSVRTDAAENQVTMPTDFYAVIAWLKDHHIDTTPKVAITTTKL